MMIWKVICKVDCSSYRRAYYAASEMGAVMIADLFGGVVGTERIEGLTDADAHDKLADSFWALVAHFRSDCDWPEIKEICERATGYGRTL